MQNVSERRALRYTRVPTNGHIRYKDVYDLKKVITTEFNIEGNPIDRFIDLVLDVVPTQVTLVPDAVDALTSNGGWDTIANNAFLTGRLLPVSRQKVSAPRSLSTPGPK